MVKRKFWVWMYQNTDKSLEDWEKYLKRLTENGISGLILQSDIENIARALQANKKFGLEIHAWIISLLYRPKDKEITDYSKYAMVNRNDVAMTEETPYVDYYKWICPNKALGVLKKEIEKYLLIPGLDGIQLDYIRYPDVILAKRLQKKYGLKQDKEFAEFDYCYCNICRELFIDKYGQDPIKLSNPPENSDWVRFRYDSITNLVNELSKSLEKKIDISAAVFPTPTIAKKLVRQDWQNWKVNKIFPMIYNYFYAEKVDWIGKCVDNIVKQNVRKKIYAGLYLPEMDIEEYRKALNLALKNGADGVCLFHSEAIKTEHLRILRNLL